MFCSRCANQMENDARFCTRCGFELELAVPQQKVRHPLGSIVTHRNVNHNSCSSFQRVKMVVAIIVGVICYFIGSVLASELHYYFNTKGETINLIDAVTGIIGYIVVIIGAVLVLFGVKGLTATSK